MEQLDLGEARELLRRMRDDVANRYHEVRHAAANHDASDPGDAADNAVQTDALDDLDRESEKLREQLKEIDEADERIARGTYGICEVCGEPIDPRRLRAVPLTRMCSTDAKTAAHARREEDRTPTL